MRYLSGSPFSVAVGSGKVSQEQWDGIFNNGRVENAVALPRKAPAAPLVGALGFPATAAPFAWTNRGTKT